MQKQRTVAPAVYNIIVIVKPVVWGFFSLVVVVLLGLHLPPPQMKID